MQPVGYVSQSSSRGGSSPSAGTEDNQRPLGSV